MSGCHSMIYVITCSACKGSTYNGSLILVMLIHFSIQIP